MEYIETIIQGGAVGLALAQLGFMYYLVKSFGELVRNHISHSTKVQVKLTLAIEKLVMVVSSLDRKLNHGKK